MFEEDGEGFLVMEYVEGITLEGAVRQHIKRGTWFDADEARDYFVQLLQGLSFAHSRGLYHRDIKPSNILVSKIGVVKLVDFGIAKPMVADPSDYEHHETGMAWTGTPNFMSPEQATGLHLDHLTDTFSAGIVGYILFTGRHPFNHPSGVTSVLELIKEPTFECADLSSVAPKGFSESECKALMRMLRKDKIHRCQSLIEPLSEFTQAGQQTCPECDSPNPRANNFCGQCGSTLQLPEKNIETPTGPYFPGRQKTASELTDEGFAFTRQDAWEDAIACYLSAVQRDSKYTRAYANLGYAYNRVGKYQEAIDWLTKGIDNGNPPSDLLHRLYDARGFAKSNLKNYEGAVQDFTVAMQHNPNNPRVYYHRAESRALAGDFREAYSDVKRALDLDPFHAGAGRLKQRLETQGYV